MQYENIPTVRLLIIAEIYGLPDAELSCSVQICNFSRHSSRKRSTTRQLLDIARSLAVPRQDGGKLVLFETSYGVRRCLEPSLRCFLPRCFFSPYKSAIQKTARKWCQQPLQHLQVRLPLLQLLCHYGTKLAATNLQICKFIVPQCSNAFP